MTKPVDVVMTLTGGCLCGAVRYRATGNPSSPTLCHCASCRKASGAPAVAWISMPMPGFEWLDGTPKRFASSPGVERTFCGECGTPLTYQRKETPAEIDLMVGTFDDAAPFGPIDQTWTEHQLPWWDKLGNLPKFKRTRTD